MDHFDTSREMVLAYYPNYWGRKPYIDVVNIQIVPDKEAQMSLFENGEIDLVEPIAVDWLKYTDNEVVKGISYPSTHLEFIGFNFREEKWQDKALRQVIDSVVERQHIVDAIYFGHGTVTHVPIHPAAWFFQHSESPVEEEMKEEYSLVDAIELPEDTTFTILTNEENPLRIKSAEAIAASLEVVGLMTSVEVLPWEDVQQRLQDGHFDMVLTGWHFSLIPDLSFAFHSTQEEMGNFIGYNNEEIDLLLETIFRAPNRTKKEAAWHELQGHLDEEIPYVSLFFKEKALLYRTTLKGELVPNQYDIFRGIETAYLIRPREEIIYTEE